MAWVTNASLQYIFILLIIKIYLNYKRQHIFILFIIKTYLNNEINIKNDILKTQKDLEVKLVLQR